MIKNYFKIAWRNLLKNKSFSAVNIIGLAIGMTGALLIALWLQNMLTMDRYHEKSDRLYVISNHDESNGQKSAWLYTPKIMGPTLKEEYPEIEEYSRFDNYNQFLTTYQDKKLMAKVAKADPGFLKMFSYPLVAGNKDKALKDENSIVLTESFSKSLFGNENPIGKIIKIDSVNLVTVDAVIKDLPSNTNVKFDYLLSYDYDKKLNYEDDDWFNNSLFTYILLKEGVDINSFNQKIKLVSQKHAPDFEGSKNTLEIFAFPFKDTYLYNNGEGGDYKSGRIDLVRLFTWIGAFILIVACINFMNLSTAKSEKRAKEVGVRKVVGAKRSSLIFQFISESILISLIALIISIGIVILLLPAFNSLVDKQLTISLLSWSTWFYLLIFAIATGIVAGIYPAILLSGFTPIKTLKENFSGNRKGFNLRSILVVLQFSISIILIISTIIVTQQINYTKNRDQGFNQNNLAYTAINGDLRKNYESLRNELLASNAVVSVSKNHSPITDAYSRGAGYSWSGSTLEDAKNLQFTRFSSDADAVKTLGLKISQGRDLDIYSYPTDSSGILLSESAVKKMRLENPIGTIIKGDDNNWTVVGVIKDFIIDSPFDRIEPLIVFGSKFFSLTIHYRLNPKNSTEQNLNTISNIFKKFNPDYPFEYEFVDKRYEEKFNEAKAVGTISTFFAGLTIFISCLGLLALISFIIELKTKEIAVRKVLGASMVQLTSLLTTNFIKLVFLAIIIACPIAYWVMNNWLKDYNYRIEIQWWMFVVAGLSAICIAFLTISFQTVKAALTNPVNSLRNE